LRGNYIFKFLTETDDDLVEPFKLSDDVFAGPFDYKIGCEGKLIKCRCLRYASATSLSPSKVRVAGYPDWECQQCAKRNNFMTNLLLRQCQRRKWKEWPCRNKLLLINLVLALVVVVIALLVVAMAFC